MSDRDRYVPTPEELEEGKLKKLKRDEGQDGEAEEPKRLLNFLRRRTGVGKRRKYEEAESKKVDPKAPARALDDADLEATEASPLGKPAGNRVRSVRVRRRETKTVTPLYPPNSPQAVFHQKATSKGHKMGQLKRVPNSPNWIAACEACGLDGELVIQHDENYVNQTYELPRGAVIERTCPE